MPLATGQHLSFYEILGPLGAGGMGEVYRAKDTRLEREVAIKILPEHFADDEERLWRFEREAKTLASLNHPNVAGIHGVDKEGDVWFLALELVPGEDLATRLARGPLPVDEALDVCRQIAEGLEAAHEAGVVHRDLKPANVHVTPAGVVKVLDFGLAKPSGAEPSAGSSTAKEDTFLRTEDGLVLGTPTYMSPEQARGQPVDKRTDVWAFGCVLFECLTGARAFAGESLAEVIGAVLHAPVDLSALPEATPWRVRELVESCLERDPRRRLRDLGDARRALERAAQDHTTPPSGAAPAPSRARAGGLAVTAIVAAGVAVGAWFLGRAGRVPAPPELTQLALELAPSDGLGPSRRNHVAHPSLALTADGRRLVFTGYAPGEPSAIEHERLGDTVVYVRSLDQAAATPLPGTEGAFDLFLSPDDRWVGFVRGGEVYRVSIDGGPVERLARLADAGVASPSSLVSVDEDFFGACFDRDGAVIFGRFGEGLWEIPAGSDRAVPLTAVEHGWHRLPHLLPGGEHLLLTVDLPDEKCSVAVVPRRGGVPTILIENASDGRFVAPDHLLFVRDGVLMAAPFDAEHLAVTGAASALASNVMQSTESGAPALNVQAGQFDVSSSGTLVYAEGGVFKATPGRLEWVSRDGTVEPLDLPVGYYARANLSPDGQRVIVSYAPEGEPVSSNRPTVFDLARGSRARLADSDGYWGPLWSHDASRAYSQGENAINELDLTGAAPTPLPGTTFGQVSCTSHDGRWLYFVKRSEAGGEDILRYELTGAHVVEPVVQTRFNEAWAELSSDDALLAFASDVSGAFEVYVQPTDDPSARVQVSTDGGNSPCWSPDGSELFFVRLAPSAREVWAVDVDRDPALAFGRPHKLFEGKFLTLGGLSSYGVAPDGRFLMTERLDDEVKLVTHLHVVTGWLPDMPVVGLAAER